MHIDAIKSMKISGNIITDGGGPVKGPGSPPTSTKLSSAFSAWGGSYGGSGGKSEDCDTSYFSVTDEQVNAIFTIIYTYWNTTILHLKMF